MMVVGCATSESAKQKLYEDTQDLKLFWPAPPQTPRIQFVRSISVLSDLGTNKSWFKQMLNHVFGEDESEGLILRPYGVVADSDRIYVTDPGISVLHVFDMKEKKYFNIQKANGADFVSPIGVAVDKNGDILLSDSVLKKIFVFNKDGKYLKDIGSAEIFKRPTGIALMRREFM